MTFGNLSNRKGNEDSTVCGEGEQEENQDKCGGGQS